VETGYGYIKKGERLYSRNEYLGFTVDSFIEKPDFETAKKYTESNDYLWNSGMFLFNAKRYLDELDLFRPDILHACKEALECTDSDRDFIRLKDGAFEACPAESIDYAVMENTQEAAVVPMESGWNDVGSWSALWDITHKNVDNNAIKGDVIAVDSNNCYLHSDDKLLATVGVDNLIVVETKDAILVADKDQVQNVKMVVDQLRESERSEHRLHREVYRPWGKYDSIDSGKRDHVKRITVNPGEKLSIQMHHHRSEHWIVVAGTAKVTNGDKTFLVSEDESTYIPLGTVHALENPGRIPLEMIEVQTGSYLSEDDIVRFEDRYGRS
jgi:mannose-1-phosphate guanylyltransferase